MSERFTLSQHLAVAAVPVVGSVWESRHGNHLGLRVEVAGVHENHNVQVKLLGGGGFTKARAEGKKYYTIGWGKFLNRYVCVELPKTKSATRRALPAFKLVDPVTAVIEEMQTGVQSVGRLIQQPEPVPHVEEKQELATAVAEALTMPIDEISGDKPFELGEVVAIETRQRKHRPPMSDATKDLLRLRREQIMANELLRLTSAEKQEIRQLHNDDPLHYTVGELARAYKVSVGAIGRVLNPREAEREVIEVVAEEGPVEMPAPRVRRPRTAKNTQPKRTWRVRRLVMKPVEEEITVEAGWLVEAVKLASEGSLEILSINPVA